MIRVWRWVVNLMITSMIFFPEKTFYEKPEDYGFLFEEVRIPTADGLKLHGWHLKASDAKGTLLFFHGNAGNISGRLSKAKGWIDRGLSVVLVDYRGYGKSEGKIDHGDDIVRDAEAALAWLLEAKGTPVSKIILYGESLGSHPALRLASEHAVAAVILEAPFTSFVELGRRHYSVVPGIELLLKDFRFANIEWIAKLKSPLFVLHGTADEVCPYAMSGELVDLAPEPKGFLSIPGGAHNDLPVAAGEDFWQKPYEFVSQYLAER